MVEVLDFRLDIPNKILSYDIKFKKTTNFLKGFKELMRSNETNEVKMPKGLEGGKEKIVFGNIADIFEWHKRFLFYI